MAAGGSRQEEDSRICFNPVIVLKLIRIKLI